MAGKLGSTRGQKVHNTGIQRPKAVKANTTGIRPKGRNTGTFSTTRMKKW
jgi:hypothetical protein